MNGIFIVIRNNFIKAVFWQVDDKISWVIFCLIDVRIRKMGEQ